MSCTDSDINENSFLFIRDKFTEMRPKGRNALLTNKATEIREAKQLVSCLRQFFFLSVIKLNENETWGKANYCTECNYIVSLENMVLVSILILS